MPMAGEGEQYDHVSVKPFHRLLNICQADDAAARPKTKENPVSAYLKNALRLLDEIQRDRMFRIELRANFQPRFGS